MPRRADGYHRIDKQFVNSQRCFSRAREGVNDDRVDVGIAQVDLTSTCLSNSDRPLTQRLFDFANANGAEFARGIIGCAVDDRRKRTP